MPQTILVRRADAAEVTSALNQCIQIAIDGEQAYGVAATRVHDVGLCVLFQEKSQDRGAFSFALTSALLRIGAHAAKRAAGRTATQGRETEHGDRVIVLEWVRREQLAVTALREIWTRTPLRAFREDMSAMLAGQYAAIIADRDLARHHLAFTQ